MNKMNQSINRKIITPLLLLPVWFLIYHFLKPVTDWIIDNALSMTVVAILQKHEIFCSKSQRFVTPDTDNFSGRNCPFIFFT